VKEASLTCNEVLRLGSLPTVSTINSSFKYGGVLGFDFNTVSKEDASSESYISLKLNIRKA